MMTNNITVCDVPDYSHPIIKLEEIKEGFTDAHYSSVLNLHLLLERAWSVRTPTLLPGVHRQTKTTRTPLLIIVRHWQELTGLRYTEL